MILLNFLIIIINIMLLFLKPNFHITFLIVSSIVIYSYGISELILTTFYCIKYRKNISETIAKKKYILTIILNFTTIVLTFLTIIICGWEHSILSISVIPCLVMVKNKNDGLFYNINNKLHILKFKFYACNLLEIIEIKPLLENMVEITYKIGNKKITEIVSSKSIVL